MTKSTWYALGILALAIACAGPQALKVPAGALKLDPSRSQITAVAIKNESKEVPVHFGGLKGWAALDGKGEVRIPLGGLQTGDPARDQNVKSLFFEVEKAAAFAQAEFKLSGVEGGLEGLAEGKTLTAKALGSLTLHGGSLPLAGQLLFTKHGQAVTATLGEGWAISIGQTTLVAALKNLNTNCPQPHRVGDKVALSGTLVFIP